MLRILPRRGRMAWVDLSLPCFADPAALSPSTMKISPWLGSLVAQSASLPGRTVLVRRLLRLTISLAALAATAACCAAVAFSTMALRMSGRHSKRVVSSSDSTDSTAGLTSGLPSLPLVWPSNSGSTTLTLTIAVSPSLMNSPGILASCFTFPALMAHWLTVLVRQFLRPSTWLPPSFVRMLLQKERTVSEYESDDHLSAIETDTGAGDLLEPEQTTVPPEGLSRWAMFSLARLSCAFFAAALAFSSPPMRLALLLQSSSAYSASPPSWLNSVTSGRSALASVRTMRRPGFRYASSSMRPTRRSASNVTHGRPSDPLNTRASGRNVTEVPDVNGPSRDGSSGTRPKVDDVGTPRAKDIVKTEPPRRTLTSTHSLSALTTLTPTP
mmetsp:Transcript_28372/g.56690  ORF Transcript_28372/g.56690 Transcript_28372/m.56690 type:complete len:384 (-) Transcript_28372:596-1747(-)